MNIYCLKRKSLLLPIVLTFIMICSAPLHADWLSQQNDPDVDSGTSSAQTNASQNSSANSSSADFSDYVTFLTAESAGMQVNLSWEPLSSGNKYLVFRYSSMIKTVEIAKALQPIATVVDVGTYVDSPGVGDFYYAVLAERVSDGARSYNLVMDQNYTSEPVHVQQAAPTMPQPATMISATAINASTVGIDWTYQESNGIVFNVYRSTAQIKSETDLNSAASVAHQNSPANAYVDKGLAAGSYYYAVTVSKDGMENKAIVEGQNATVTPVVIAGTNISQQSAPTQATQQAPPTFNAILTITPPPLIVKSSNYRITGSWSGDVVRRIEMTPRNFLAMPDFTAKTFYANVKLNEGNNTFTFKAIGTNNLFVTASVTIFYQKEQVQTAQADTTPPQITFNKYPEYTTNSNLRLSGIARDEAIRSVEIEPYEITALLNNITGAWAASVVLSEGDNVIDVIASDKNGNTNVATISIRYVKPVVDTTDYAAVIETAINEFYRHNYRESLSMLIDALDSENLSEPLRNKARLFEARNYYELREYNRALKLFVELESVFPEEADFWIDQCAKNMN